MGQKVHPIGFRLGVYKEHTARWYTPLRNYGKNVVEDLKIIRPFILKYVDATDVAGIEIEREADSVKVIIHSSRPGFIIGKKGLGIDGLKNDLAKKIGKTSVEVSVLEVKNPDLNATLLAKSITSQIEKYVNYKKAAKKAALNALRAGAKGVNIRCAGRLAGAEIARDYWIRLGSVPRQTLIADIDYALAEAKTTYGIIGVQVWVCRGSMHNMRKS